MSSPRRVLTVVQARLGSTRLPGKVLLPLGKRTVLEQMLRRVTAAKLCGQVVVATTVDGEDQAVAEVAERSGVDVFRGHPTDLLDRHFRAARRYSADIIVKIPSDCPLIDPAVIDRVIGAYLESSEAYDYLSNLHPQSYPDGNDVEVMSRSALERAWREATLPHEREHTTPFLWDNPDRFTLGNVVWDRGCDLSATHRWVLDYAEDYHLISAVFDALNGDERLFSVEEITSLIESRPAIRELNASRLGDAWYGRARHVLKTLRNDRSDSGVEIGDPVSEAMPMGGSR